MQIDFGEFRITLTVADPLVLATLARIEAKLDQAAIQGAINMKTLDDILAETTRGTTLETSLETLLAGLKAQIDAAGGNQAKIDAAFTAMAARNDHAAAALVANTPAAPPTP